MPKANPHGRRSSRPVRSGRAFQKQRMDAAQELLESGLKRYEVLLKTYQDLAVDDNTLKKDCGPS